MNSLFNDQISAQLQNLGISVEKVTSQLENFKTGFPYLNVISAATPAKGITVMDEAQISEALNLYESSQLKIAKFVPASGAASRMFKDLFNAVDTLEKGGSPSECAAEKFVTNIKDFAFYTPEEFDGKSELETLKKVLDADQMGYGVKPKGVLKFHKYNAQELKDLSISDISEESRTAFEEHLVEGALYAQKGGVVEIIVSVSPEHQKGFEQLFDSVKEKYENRYNVKYNIHFTQQMPSTDTVAVNEDNTPFIKSDGNLLFRPGGHGALIYNLNEIDADVVIIKNIDNVVKQSYIEETVLWKKIVVGKLLQARAKTFKYLEQLESVSDEKELENLCNEIVKYIDNEYCITIPEMPASELPKFLKNKLNRPIRVCGMVKNVGEPGGGPFIIKEEDATTSLQILESVQLNPNDPKVMEMFHSGTHFNPVDLVCSLKDYKGEKFDLPAFVDPKAGFISSKSYEGRSLKAQELPGLWNGAMSDWNTIFVDVPLITFNPVKTIFDLLRKEHR